MEKYIIMCRSITAAQRCARQLEASLIRAAVIKAPREISSGGCGYCLTLKNKIKEAVALLRGKNIPFGKIYVYDESAGYREVSV